MSSLLVTGANGQLGSELRELTSKYPSYNFIFTDIEELNITDHNLVEQFIVVNKNC